MGALTEVARVLGGARHLLVLTGSGVSAESGVPTFREAQSGLWARFDPHELATPEAFLADPALVWRWYRWRRELVAGVEPNPGHLALARLQSRIERLTLVTQNVDGLHQRAGSRNVTEFHGNLFVSRCFTCNLEAADDSEQAVPECASCGGLLRPGVVWFGEAIPAAALAESEAALNDCDVFLSIGTSSLVWPAAGFMQQAARRGVTVIELNLEQTPNTPLADFSLQGKSGERLPELVDCLDSAT